MPVVSPLDALNNVEAAGSKLAAIKNFLVRNWQLWILMASLLGLHIQVKTDPNATAPSIVVVVPSVPVVSSTPDQPMPPLAQEVDKINRALELMKSRKFKTFKEAYESVK